MDWDAVRRNIDASKRVAHSPVPARAKPPMEAVTKAPEERTEEDVAALVKFLDSLHVSFIEDYFPAEDHASVLEATCRALKFESLGPDQIVFSKGDRADKFYVVIAGSASVWITQADDSGEYPTTANLTRRQLMRKSSNVLTPSIDRLAVDKRRSVGRRGGGSRGPVVVANPLAGLGGGDGSSDDGSSTGGGGGEDGGEARPSVMLRQSSVSGRRSSDSRRKRVSVNPNTPETDSANARSISDVVTKDQETFVGFMRPGGPTGSFGELGLVSESSSRTASVRTGTNGAEFLTLDRDAFDRVLKEKFVAALDAKVAEMKGFAIFEGITDSHLRILALYVQRRRFKAGDVIARTGQQAQSISCLLSGQCDLALAKEKGGPGLNKRASLRERPEVTYTRIAVVPAGSVIGQKEALSTPTRPFQHHVRAVDDVTVLQIEREAYVRRVRQDLWKAI